MWLLLTVLDGGHHHDESVINASLCRHSNAHYFVFPLTNPFQCSHSRHQAIFFRRPFISSFIDHGTTTTNNNNNSKTKQRKEANIYQEISGINAL